MPKTVIMYPKLRKYLQNIKKTKQIKYTELSKTMNLHKNVVTSWFCGLRFPRASNIMPLAQAIGASKEEGNAIALQILTIASEE